MKISRRMTLALGAGAVLAFMMSPALAAETTITASLWDIGPDAMDMSGKMPELGMAMSPGADMGMATMGIKLSAASAPAGTITFTATNDSKDTIHEMVLTPVTNTSTPLPYNKAEMKVDEDAAGHLGEVAELDPGASGSLTIDVVPGTYIPGHYAMGMWTIFTVTE